ncbi:MAG: glycosyltransferase family 39 protein [Chloroflexota bacterium]|nr:glycosyltransferase family 39 protein [Chloroflexota bacterium]
MRRINSWIALLTIVLVAFALRAFHLGAQSLWYDEAFSVYLAHFSLADITARTAADIQPPLYYYLLHCWIVLAGDSEFAVRFLSLFFGALMIPLMFVTGRRLFTSSLDLPRFAEEGTIAALLAALSPLYVWYSQETRMYTLITFLLLLSSYALRRALSPSPSQGEGRGEGRWWLVFALANIAAVHTHYFAFVVIVFQLLFALVSQFKVQGSRLFNFELRTLKLLTCSFVAVIVAFLPWTPFVLARFGQDASYWRGALKLDEAIRHIFINFTTGESVLEAQAQWIAAGWLGCLMVGLLAWVIIAMRKNQTTEPVNHPTTFLVLYLVIPLALLLFVFSRNPKFNARYLMIASPPLFILLGAGLASLLAFFQRGKIFARIVSGALLLLAFIFLLLTSAYADSNVYFDPAFTKADFRGVARYVDEHRASDEAIILTSGHLFPAFDYYYRGDAPQIRLPDDPTLNADHVLGYDTANVLNQTLAGKRGAWVVLWQDDVVDPNGFVPMLLSSRGKEQKVDASFWQVKLRHWTLPTDVSFSPLPAPAVAREANFNNAVKLLGFDALNPTPADVGASFNLYWQTLDTLPDDYSVALRVLDAAGNLWGKQDRRPAGYNYPTNRWKKGENLFGAYTVPLLAGAPAGDYFIEVTLYTKRDESGLDVLAPNGAPIGKTVKVGPIPVLPATQPATFAALNIQNTISQPIGPFTLLGYQLSRDKASAGESIPLTLFWRADTKPEKDYTFRVQFGDVASDALPLSNLQSPTSTWRAEDIVRGQYAIAIPATAKDGATQLRITLSDGSALDLAAFTIEKTDRVFVKPNAPFAQAANFVNAIALDGYQLPAIVKPGDTLTVTLYWQARGKTDKPYTVFVHLLGNDGKPIAQKDAQPQNGARPTTGWVANEYIADNYELPIAASTAPGKYQIEIGWYDAKDPAFARLQVLDDNGVPAGDRVILKTLVEVSAK